MLENSVAYSGFSVDNLAKAQEFYGETLGLAVTDNGMGLTLRIKGRNGIFIYQKDDHQPATYTILNFPVDDIEKAVDELAAKGVAFEHYEGMTDAKGIARDPDPAHPLIAWFKDSAGNYLSVLQRRKG